MGYAEERDAAVATPQAILTLGVPRCCNFYAQTFDQELDHTEDLDFVTNWTRAAGTSVTINAGASPKGTLNANLVAFASVADYLMNWLLDGVAASHAFTFSIFAYASAPGTVTMKATDSTASETTTLVASIATGWNRVYFHRLYTAGATGAPRFRIERAGGDLASIYLWGANVSRNPGDVDADVLFPYVPRFGAIGADNRASRCTAADAGDGLRCTYTGPGCQDPAHYNPGNPFEPTPDLRGIREHKFCLKQAPLPIKGANIRPMLAGYDQAPQEIDGIRGAVEQDSSGGFVTRNEQVTYSLEDDADVGVWDVDKQSIGALVNTGPGAGTFLRRWIAVHLNYSNPLGYARLACGYLFAGATEADFKQRLRGPMTGFSIGADGIARVTATDGLARAKFSIPPKISDGNLVQGPIDASTTSLYVDNPSEVSEPAPNASAPETFDVDGKRTGGPDWVVTLVLDAEKVNVLAKTAGDNPLTIQRGRWGTVATAHANRIVFSEVCEYGTEQSVPANPVLGKNPIDIKLSDYRRCGIPWAEINSAFCIAQRDAWCYSSIDPIFGVTSGILFRRTLTEPTEIDALLQEVDRDLVSFQFVDEDGLVNTKIFAPPTPTETLAEVTDVSNLLENSVSVEDIHDARLTRVIAAWALTAGKTGDVVGDYDNVDVEVEEELETAGFYGAIRDHVILSKWVRPSDATTMPAAAARILARFRNGARLVVGQLDAKDDDAVRLGGFVYLTTEKIQNPDGTTAAKRIVQVVKKQRDPAGARMTITFLDTGILRRTIFIAPAGLPAYDSQTLEQQRYWSIGDAQNRLGAAKVDGFYIR